MNKLDLENPKVLIWPKQVDTTKGKNMLIGEPRTTKADEKTSPRKAVVEKSPGGIESLKIIVRGSNSGGHTPKIEENSKTELNAKMKGQNLMYRGGRSDRAEGRSNCQEFRKPAEDIQAAESRSWQVERR